MENWKELLASFGLWLLVEDISDDGDGEGDNLQLTKDGELFVSEIQQELDKAREEGVKDGMRGMIDILCEKGCGSMFAVIEEKDVNKKIEELSKLKTKEDGK